MFHPFYMEYKSCLTEAQRNQLSMGGSGRGLAAAFIAAGKMPLEPPVDGIRELHPVQIRVLDKAARQTLEVIESVFKEYGIS